MLWVENMKHFKMTTHIRAKKNGSIWGNDLYIDNMIFSPCMWCEGWNFLFSLCAIGVYNVNEEMENHVFFYEG